MKIALVIAALAVAACGGKSGKATTPSTGATQDVAAAARATVDEWQKAYEARNTDALGKLYVHEQDVLLVQDGVPTRGWSAIEPLLRDRLSRAKDIHLKLKDVQVTPLGADTALALATITREISDGTTSVAENGVVTFVLRADASGWHILAEHYSRRQG